MTDEELRNKTTSTPWAKGMTLRDWFAGHALAAAVARDTYIATSTQISMSRDAIAKRAYDMADAMLAERGRR